MATVDFDFRDRVTTRLPSLFPHDTPPSLLSTRLLPKALEPEQSTSDNSNPRGCTDTRSRDSNIQTRSHKRLGPVLSPLGLF